MSSTRRMIGSSITLNQATIQDNIKEASKPTRTQNNLLDKGHFHHIVYHRYWQYNKHHHFHKMKLLLVPTAPLEFLHFALNISTVYSNQI